MTVLRKDWVRLPGEDSKFGSGKHIRRGGLIDGEYSDLRSKDYCGIVPAHQAIGNKENWHISIQDEENRLKPNKFVPSDDRFWASLDGKAIMSLGEALDSAHGLAVNTFDFSEPDLKEEEGEEEQELEKEPGMDLSYETSEWVRERYGEVLIEHEEENVKLQVFRIHPQIERKKISFNLKLHCLWALKHKKPPQKRKISCRRARHKHQLFF